MGKHSKCFIGGIDTLFGDRKEGGDSKEVTFSKGRPKTQSKEITKSSQEGTLEGETRATFIVKEDLLQSIKAVAFFERQQIKAVINQALEDFLQGKGQDYIKTAVKEYKEKH